MARDPMTFAEMDSLRLFTSDDTLRGMGFVPWEEPHVGVIHWLFPEDLYDRIPNGYPVVVINGKTEKFVHNQTPSDTRYRCLAYGWIRPRMKTARIEVPLP